MPPTPRPPRDHYVWLGRVMSACSMLEVQVGMIAWAWDTGEPWTETWSDVAGGPGAAWKRCKQVARAISETDAELGASVQQLLDDAVPVREDRNNFAHAVFILDPSRAIDDQWILKSARVREFRPLTEGRGAALVTSANQLSKRAKVLSGRVAKAAQRRAAGVESGS